MREGRVFQRIFVVVVVILAVSMFVVAGLAADWLTAVLVSLPLVIILELFIVLILTYVPRQRRRFEAIEQELAADD